MGIYRIAVVVIAAFIMVLLKRDASVLSKKAKKGHCLAKKGKNDKKRCKKPTAFAVPSPTFDPTQEPTFDPTQEPTFDPTQTQEPSTAPPTYHPLIVPFYHGNVMYGGEVVTGFDNYDCSITAEWELINYSENNFWFKAYLDVCDTNKLSTDTASTQNPYETSKGEAKFYVYSEGCYRVYFTDAMDSTLLVSDKIIIPGCA